MNPAGRELWLKQSLSPFEDPQSLQTPAGRYMFTTIKAENYLSHTLFLSSRVHKCSCHPHGHRYHRSDRHMSGGSWGHIVPGDTLQRINKSLEKNKLASPKKDECDRELIQTHAPHRVSQLPDVPKGCGTHAFLHSVLISNFIQTLLVCHYLLT